MISMTEPLVCIGSEQRIAARHHDRLAVVYVRQSSLDQVETAILASALETIDRVGPCKAKIDIENIEDVRAMKKNKIIDRAKELLDDVRSKRAYFSKIYIEGLLGRGLLYTKSSIYPINYNIE